MLAHELRNPLAPIRNALLILRPGAGAVDTGWAVAIMERQVRHMARLIDDLLDVSRITRGKIELRKERVDLAAIVAHAVETGRPLIDARRHRLTVDACRREPVLARRRPGPAGAGRRQPAEQRREVHRRGRPDQL